jgi:hypothetical protein
LVLYNIESHAIALHPEKTALMLQKKAANYNARNYLSSFNTKFAVFVSIDILQIANFDQTRLDKLDLIFFFPPAQQ